MAHKKIVAVFNDFASAENASYQISKRHVKVADMAMYQKDLNRPLQVEDDRDDDKTSALAVAYQRDPPIAGGFATPLNSLNIISDTVTPGIKDKKIMDKFAMEVSEGQVLWSVKVDSDRTRQVCDILDHCGAVLIEKL